jgi:hypothetical protein
MALTLNGNNNTIGGVAVGGLPDGIVDTDMLAANAVTAAKATGSAKGITMSQLWRINANFDCAASHGDITANWEAADSATSGNIGSSMTESSGVFTFPSTGVYLIQFVCGFYKSGVSRRYLGAAITTTPDNSTYSQASINYGSITSNSGSTHTTVVTNAIFDVTNTSTHKCKFYLANVDTISIHGNSSINWTSAMFTRLGDT